MLFLTFRNITKTTCNSYIIRTNVPFCTPHKHFKGVPNKSVWIGVQQYNCNHTDIVVITLYYTDYYEKHITFIT